MAYYKKRKGKARANESEDLIEEEDEEDGKICRSESWIRPGCEESVKRLDIRNLLHEADQVQKIIVFSGTGYGLKLMSTTAPSTVERSTFHLELYKMYQMLNTNNPDDGDGN
ncbi:hypothetical protein DFQ28_011254 [Apophysomyces sp. BC1034]|nr:hypothetical protein DFQ28_011254 [Apophysomyces sp. BC1034]